MAMAWAGKLIGGALGSFLGPWGAAIGVGIGHQFDKGARQVQTARMVLQVAFFGCLAKIAKSDGQITKDEIRAVEQVIRGLAYTPTMRAAAIAIFQEAKDDPHTAEDYLSQLASVVQFNPQIAMTFLAALHAVAQADGFIHPNERQILMAAEQAFRLPAGSVDSLLGTAKSGDVEAAYKTLDVSPEMSDLEIKKAYREKCIQFHPDKLASKGLPEEFMKYANEQVSKINAAYDIIEKHRSG
jgi:DnaJ like chaperone protein